MSVEACRLVGIEGTNGVGKTATAYALTGYLKSRSFAAQYCDESARINALVEDVTLHGRKLSMQIELQLFTAAIATQVLATRHTRILVCDKTPASLIGYTRVLIPQKLVSDDLALFEAMRLVLHEWSNAYDVVFFMADNFEFDRDEDPVRSGVTDVKWEVSSAIREELRNFHTNVIDVPTGMALSERVLWMVEEMGRLGVTAGFE